jgi:ectoine hydroxylase-related dioxygenase (phytanoyl-CoA dioxygenase family)
MSAAPIRTIPGDASVDDVCELLEADSAVIVDPMLSPAVLEEIERDLAPYFGSQEWGLNEFNGRLTRRVNGLMARSPCCADLITHPLYLGAAERILMRPKNRWIGEELVARTPNLQLSLTQATQIWPGETAQFLHRDDTLHYCEHPGNECEMRVIYALSDFTVANGATHIVPGSHLWGEDRAPLMADAVQAEMARGAGLIYMGSAYHGGGANQTKNDVRIALLFSLIVGYLRQEENQYLTVPTDVLRRYPEDVQRLLGWNLCPPFCGRVYDVDPWETIEQDSDELQTERARL